MKSTKSKKCSTARRDLNEKLCSIQKTVISCEQRFVLFIYFFEASGGIVGEGAGCPAHPIPNFWYHFWYFWYNFW